MDHHKIFHNQLHILTKLLDEVLIHQCGKSLVEKLQEIRSKAALLKQSPNKETYQALSDELTQLEPPLRGQVIRAFSTYLQLLSIVEQNQRIFLRYVFQDERENLPLSFEHVIFELTRKNVDAQIIQDVLQQLSLELVITAHPTEATRRTVLEIRKRIASTLKELNYPLLSKLDNEKKIESLYNEITTLWQTDDLRNHKPTVMDEVRHGLRYFDETLFDVLPDIHEDIEKLLKQAFPSQKWHVPNFIHFGSWIGGDRDGNPFVTSQLTWQTMLLQRDIVLKKYEEVIIELMKRFSHSTNRVNVSESFLANLEKQEQSFLTKELVWPVKTDVYRRKFQVVLERLRQIGKSAVGYQKPKQLLIDLYEMKESVSTHHSSQYQHKALQKLIRQIELYGFHLNKLDIRNHSGEHEAAVAELLKVAHIVSEYSTLEETEKQALLQKLLKDPRPVMLTHYQYSSDTKEMLNVFETIKRVQEQFGENAIDVYLISKTQSESDILEVLLLAKEAGLFQFANGKVESRLHVAPLFETITDLDAAPKIMKNLYEMPIYLKHLTARGLMQEIMIGYSDGSKDGGTLSAHWKLYKAQQEIFHVSVPYQISLKFFHGRGGSLGRGGGPLKRSLLSQPHEMFGKNVKITEQGEVLSSRYMYADLAYINLEEAATTLLKASLDYDTKSTNLKKWERAMEEISQSALEKYQQLVFAEPHFFQYFKETTPLMELGELQIGSRPMSRKNSTKFEDLRAIPWVFAWTQARVLFPAWYAAGTGLAAYANKSKENLSLLKEMYQEWPFFETMIDNLTNATTKADLLTAEEYVKLFSDKEVASQIFSDIKTEYETTTEIIAQIKDGLQPKKSPFIPSIEEWISRREPFLYALNFIQVDLIRQMRSNPERDEHLLTDALLTISAIAAGIRSTG